MNYVISLYLVISLVLAWIFGAGSLFFYNFFSPSYSSHANATALVGLEEIVQNNDIFNASLLLAQEYCEGIDIERANVTFDKVVNEIQMRIKNIDDPKVIVDIINDYLFVDYQIQPDGAIVIEHLLPDKILEHRKGHCVGLSFLYLALGERLCLPIYAKTVPFHIYVCYDDGYTKFNIETTMKGFACPDSYYSYHFPYPEKHQTIKKLSKHEVLGLLLNNLGFYLRQHPNVLNIQKKALKLFPDCAEINANTGFLLREFNESKKAKKYLIKALSLDSTLWQTNFELSNMYYENGDYKQAFESYTQTINLLHKSVKILSPYQHGLPEKEKLITLSDKMLLSREVPCENLVAFGIGLFRQEEYELSNKLFAHALKMHPEELTAHAYYAMSNFHLGNYEQARKHAQIAEDVGEQGTAQSLIFFINKIAECHMRLGESYALLNEYESGLRNIHKAIEIGGPDSRFLVSLAETYLLMGDQAEARNYYEKAMEIDPSNVWIQKKMHSLSSNKTN